MLGTFRYVGKPDRKHTASDAAVRCVVHLFVMHVAEELQTWPEHSERQRVWVKPSHALLHQNLAIACCHFHSDVTHHCPLPPAYQGYLMVWLYYGSSCRACLQ